MKIKNTKHLSAVESFSLGEMTASSINQLNNTRKVWFLCRVTARLCGPIAVASAMLIDTVAQATLGTLKLVVGLAVLPYTLLTKVTKLKKLPRDLSLTSAFIHLTIAFGSIGKSFYMPILVFLSPRRAHEMSKIGFKNDRKKYEIKLKQKPINTKIENQLNTRILNLEAEIAQKNNEIEILREEPSTESSNSRNVHNECKNNTTPSLVKFKRKKHFSPVENFSLGEMTASSINKLNHTRRVWFLCKLTARVCGPIAVACATLVDVVAQASLGLLKLVIGLAVLPYTLLAEVTNLKKLPRDLSLTSAFIHLTVAFGSIGKSFYMPILVFLSPRRAHEISKVGYRKERKKYEEKLKLNAKKSQEQDITQLENRIRTLEAELEAKCAELDSLLADIPPPPPNPAPPPPRPNIGSSRESLNSNHSQTGNTNGNHHNRSLEEETHAFSKDNNDPFVPKLSEQQREIERHNIATFEWNYIPQRNSDQRLLLNNLLSKFEFDLNDDDKTVNSTDIDIDQIELEYSDSPLQLLASLPNLCRTAKNETDPNKKMEALQNIKNYLDAWIIELDKIDNKRDTTRLAELRQKSFSEIQQSQNDKINSEINNATEKKRNDTLKALQYLNLEEIQKSSIAQRRFNHWLVAQHNNNTYVELELCNDSKIQDIQAKVESYIKRSQSINCCIDDVLNDTVYLTLTALLRHYAESADGRKYSNQYA